MINSFRYKCVMVLGLLKTTLNMPKCNKLLKSGDMSAHDNYANEVVRRWGKSCIKNSGADMEISGLENVPTDRPVLFVSNHQSNFDILLLLGILNCNKGFVAKQELGKIPLLGYWMVHTHCLFMDRSDMKQSMQTIIQAYEQLKNGYSMIIYPEGTRSKGGPVKEFKAGSFKPAIKAKVPVVPITLDGTFKVIDGDKDKSDGTDKVQVIVHPPIETADLSKEEIKELPARVQKLIVDSMKYTKNN